eukprot:scaffold7624_cov248-Pinguiococcus_pyrenoidosus.AAC.17
MLNGDSPGGPMVLHRAQEPREGVRRPSAEAEAAGRGRGAARFHSDVSDAEEPEHEGGAGGVSQEEGSEAQQEARAGRAAPEERALVPQQVQGQLRHGAPNTAQELQGQGR